ncbi:hypothetical protein [Paraburkholderia unamae]|uniref:Uncharacterized protein n=1 Tax=Paraburkholderia unamae TaxID=219649 RepID=A0ABX5K763_9BURK|nr:hypothetical protein [Paraburkholderia unamae]PVX61382.1 hypothetical protein C7402_14031 [Paraburkholderia unamae]RAR49310.1 hypothetical protein C7401_14631 [Paraburkholderia unamae]
MRRRAPLSRQASEAILLSHMELTRVQLLAENVGSRAVEFDSVRANPLSIANVVTAFASAPHVTLLGSILLSTLLIGPRRVFRVVLRSGLPGWIARDFRLRHMR